MAEVLGQRSLLGVGVLLAWLLLFHLLVNIWLLCVFTSLLVVLGGWLGSQAVLESNSVIHLERFIRLEQLHPTVEDEHQLDQEIQNTVEKIIRDFVTSWYSTVSSDSSFETEVQEAMISMATELKLRARNVDRKELLQNLLHLLGGHLQDYLRAKELVTKGRSGDGQQLWRAYSSITAPHFATSSEAVEVNHVRAIVDVLLHVLVPAPHLETRTGRFVVGELVTCNVLLPLVDRLSDPDWLNLLLIEIFAKSGSLQEKTASETVNSSQPTSAAELKQDMTAPPPPQGANTPPTDGKALQNTETEPDNDADVGLPEVAYDAIDSEETDCQQNLIEEDETSRPFLRRYMRKSNPFYQESDSDLDSPLTDYKPSSTDSLLMAAQEESPYDGHECVEVDFDDVCPGSLDSSSPKVSLTSELMENPDVGGLLSMPEYSIGLPPTTDHLQDLSRDREGVSPAANPKREFLLTVGQTGTGNHSELTVGSPMQGCSPMATFSFEPLSSPEGPVIIQNLRITGTITAKEHRGTGSHPYTLYTIKYETSVGCENPGSFQPASEDVDAAQTGLECPSPVQPVAYHMVNRRYSEFLNLQTRLEEKTELRKLIKGVKGPKKMFPDMPFGNMDSDKIEARKGLLETFLKQLCAIPEIANSEEMQEFLALNTDARIAFVKKPFLVSRIDKIVVNAIVDTLKTAFPRSEPQSPTDDNEAEVDGGKMCMDKKSKSRLKLSGKGIPFMNGTDVRPPVLFTWDQTNKVFNGMALEDLQAFISEKEKLFILRADGDEEGSTVVRQHGGCVDDGERRSQEQDEMALADVALSVLRLLMRNQWSWLCTENVQRAVRLLFGTFINRWLDVSVSNLLCTSYWVVYLQVIQEAVWPGGALPSAPPPQRSQQQRDGTRRQALQSLMKLLPDLVSDWLGTEQYKHSWETALDSFQDPFINRHLVFCVFDLLLHVLVPELSEDDVQMNPLHPRWKTPEKLPW
ncbi:sorting nexin-19 [Cololabis saira]|uniref:sorting nexin-19 n=1 Tax=Cololabis saira TaxID=129043 RepID=UPI002AD5823E|nr:sorting nexin-19 [Cololabis saira]